MSTTAEENGPASTLRIEKVSPGELEPSPVHVRSSHDPPRDRMVRSVETVGIINAPIGRYEDGNLRLIDGVERAKAANEVDIGEISVIVRDLDDIEARIQSSTLNPEVGTANNKTVTDYDRDAALDALADLTDKDRDKLEYDLGLLSEADRFVQEFETESGVGRKTADALVDADLTVEDVRSDESVSLQQISGIGKKKAQAIRRAVRADKNDGEPTIVTHDQNW